MSKTAVGLRDDHEQNEYERGYDAARDEIFDVLADREHIWKCVDCPACEVIRAVKRHIANGLVGDSAILEVINLMAFMDEEGGRD